MKLLTSIWKEHKGFGKQIFLLAKNELIKTYKGAIIGPFWAAVKPAFTVFVYWFAFSVGIKALKAVKVHLDGMEHAAFSFDFFTFMFVGIIPWFFIQESIIQGAKTLRANRQFITKVKFPVSTILTYTGLSRLFVHLFLVLILYGYVIFYRVSNGNPPFDWYDLQFFFYCPLLFYFFLALFEIPQSREPLRQLPENRVVQPSRDFLPVAGDEGDGVALVQKPDDVFDVFVSLSELFRQN